MVTVPNFIRESKRWVLRKIHEVPRGVTLTWVDSAPEAQLVGVMVEMALGEYMRAVLVEDSGRIEFEATDAILEQVIRHESLIVGTKKELDDHLERYLAEVSGQQPKQVRASASNVWRNIAEVSDRWVAQNSGFGVFLAAASETDAQTYGLLHILMCRGNRIAECSVSPGGQLYIVRLEPESSAWINESERFGSMGELREALDQVLLRLRQEGGTRV